MSALFDASALVLLAGALLLVVSGAGHLRHRAVFAATLRRHRILSPALAAAVSAVAGPVQVVLGVAALVAWLAAGPTWLAGVPLVGLYAAFALYSARALRVAPGSPCGCFGAETLTPAVPIRAGVLALGAVPALTVAPGGTLATRLAWVGAAGLVAAIAWAVPSMLALISERQGHRRQ
ncbi:MAG: hypothetical protein Q4G43_08935 [Mobilicoccus sp.]|nr:hypothetical protein [Mobilicoccus sp.]